MFLTPGSRGNRRAFGNNFQRTLYTTSQTITVPSWAHNAYIQLQGAGGAAKAALIACGGATATGGNGAYLEKSLSVVPGLTMVLTIGSPTAGSSTTSAAGTTSLVSGTMSITALTCTGGFGAYAASAGASQASSGGTASGGDLNMTGCGGLPINAAMPTGLGPGQGLPPGISAGLFGVTYGGGAVSNSGSSAVISSSGGPAACIITWFK